jgi:hypothetical protein
MSSNTKWTATENKNLARASVSASEDPRKGADQTADKFMDKVFAAFVQFMKEDKQETSRSSKSIVNQWSALNKDCAKFSALFARLTALEKSGWNEENYITHALQTWVAVEGQEDAGQAPEGEDEDGAQTPQKKKRKSEKKFSFKYLEAWKVLRIHAKWFALNQENKKSEPGAALPGDGKNRPQGQKAAKDGDKQKPTAEKLLETQEKIAESLVPIQFNDCSIKSLEALKKRTISKADVFVY